MFRVYKPKGDRVKAVQVTVVTMAEIAELFMGRVVWAEPGVTEMEKAIGVEIPTLEGNKTLRVDSWVVRTADNKIKFCDNEEFEKYYEVARSGPGS